MNDDKNYNIRRGFACLSGNYYSAEIARKSESALGFVICKSCVCKAIL